MPNALKAMWEVTAGLIPEEPMQEYTRAWVYTSNDYEADGNKRAVRFGSKDEEAREYVKHLTKGGLNWVNFSYIWL